MANRLTFWRVLAVSLFVCSFIVAQETEEKVCPGDMPATRSGHFDIAQETPSLWGVLYDLHGDYKLQGNSVTITIESGSARLNPDAPVNRNSPSDARVPLRSLRLGICYYSEIHHVPNNPRVVDSLRWTMYVPKSGWPDPISLPDAILSKWTTYEFPRTTVKVSLPGEKEVSLGGAWLCSDLENARGGYPADDIDKSRWAGEVDVMEARLGSLAGDGALNCGRTCIREDPNAASDCGSKAFEEKRAFYVRYDLQGIDSRVAAGLARDENGKLYAVFYDSMVPGGHGHTTVKACPEPATLLRSKSGRLTCFPPDPNARRDIMSPTLRPY